jgi:DNA repair photolyase
VDLIESRSIFSPATGFIRRGGFDWTCNPYVGCTFGCSYRYAAFLPQNRRPVDEWGRWLTAKSNAVELARRHAKKLAGAAVYMSSVTDPYQPAERSLFLSQAFSKHCFRISRGSSSRRAGHSSSATSTCSGSYTPFG